MESLARQSDFRVSAFLAAGHVCAVLGFAEYEPFVDRFRLPVVVSGFEPTDLLEGLFEAVSQLERGAAQVANAYGRGVRRDGNSAAKSVIDAVYESVDCPWRGLGIIAGGGLRLREEWRGFDARARGMTNTRIASTSVDSDPVADGSRGADGSATPASLSDCPAGEVLIGRMKPSACPHFGGRCTPDSPLGAPMVSAEGACAAYFRYGHQRVSS